MRCGRPRLVIANSESTRRAVDRAGRRRTGRVRTVYLGSDPSWGAADASGADRGARALQLPADRPVVLFVGALGTDINKGFDVLWRSWTEPGRAPGSWDASLVVAGGGWRVAGWQARGRAERGRESRSDSSASHRDIREVLAAGDLLVSPVRYEAYGLNVHEALCRGLAVMVTRTPAWSSGSTTRWRRRCCRTGVTPTQLAERLRAWRADVDGWRARAATTAARLRARSWADMAAELVAVVATVRGAGDSA